MNARDIGIAEATHCQEGALPPEGNVKLHNYRLIEGNVRAYSPTGDVHTSPSKGKLVPRFEFCNSISPPRARILQLLRPEDPGREALEAIVKPAPRRGLIRPLDEDTRRFLQRALLSPSPQGFSAPVTPEPTSERSLAEELREAEEKENSDTMERHEAAKECRRRIGDALERDRLGRLALAVDEESCGDSVTCTARRLDALLSESRELHEELEEIGADIQRELARAVRCETAARALGEDAQRLRYLDDVLALLRGDLEEATRARTWPFAFVGQRDPNRNYIV